MRDEDFYSPITHHLSLITERSEKGGDMAQPGHLISVEAAVTLDGLLRERVKRKPDPVACRAYNEPHKNWRDYTWAQIDHQVARWQAELEKESLKRGDRVGGMLKNSPEWVTYDQAALGLGLVVVPLYTQDRA